MKTKSDFGLKDGPDAMWRILQKGTCTWQGLHKNLPCACTCRTQEAWEAVF